MIEPAVSARLDVTGVRKAALAWLPVSGVGLCFRRSTLCLKGVQQRQGFGHAIHEARFISCQVVEHLNPVYQLSIGLAGYAHM
jgi:hypothetical protein